MRPRRIFPFEKRTEFSKIFGMGNEEAHCALRPESRQIQEN
jgi:hypothetical protein